MTICASDLYKMTTCYDLSYKGYVRKHPLTRAIKLYIFWINEIEFADRADKITPNKHEINCHQSLASDFNI